MPSTRKRPNKQENLQKQKCTWPINADKQPHLIGDHNRKRGFPSGGGERKAGTSCTPGSPPATSFGGQCVGTGIWGQMAPLTEFELHALCDPTAAALTVCPARTRMRARTRRRHATGAKTVWTKGPSCVSAASRQEGR